MPNLNNWLRHTPAGRTAANVFGVLIAVSIGAALIAVSLYFDHLRSVIFWGAR